MPRYQLLLVGMMAIVLSLSATATVWAAGGTMVVAEPGRPAYVQEGWPKGAGELVNDPLRTTGWKPWFTEYPNDVDHYAFAAKSTADLNRLIEKLTAIESGIKQIHLSHLKEPGPLGFVTSVPVGNNIPVLFSIGDQSRIDEWFKTVKKPFGLMNFYATPVAVPPTLTIFVRNDAVNLDELKIPSGIEVSSGLLPGGFHRANTIEEREREQRATTRPASNPPPDDASKAAQARIDTFLKKHHDAANR